MYDDVALYGRSGKSVYRLCETVFYDYQGKPRGFLVGRTIYDQQGQHRGFYVGNFVRDRRGKVLGFSEGASPNGLQLPFPEIPPIPYKNLPASDPPAGLTDRDCPAAPPVWSIMRLENLLV